MVQYLPCQLCHKPLKGLREQKARKNGRYICDHCWKLYKADREKYEQHWFVKSLQFRYPKIEPLPRKKSLPGQQLLFPPEEQPYENP